MIYLVGKPERRRGHDRGTDQDIPPEARREARQQARQEACNVVCDLVRRFGLTVVAIGNGTACREAEDFFAELIADRLKDDGVAFAIVNEAGASVYSTSRSGREEFPHYDATLRGAISIGRRLQDPLSELVKIDPANIGVGLYQHDVKAKHLRVSLDDVVESCVNYVGVDVNTASPALLRYVSGLNQLTARRLYEHRLEHGPYRNRQQFRDVPGFGEATFVQAAGFLKIAGGENPLDATWIHPESYPLADRVMNTLGTSLECLTKKEALGSLAEKIAALDASQLATEFEVGTLLLGDILAQLARPGRDPREDLPGPVFKQGVLKLEDLEPGMELNGTVLNVVDFGAFVDIGMHDSGLVHVSQLADKFIRDPHDLVAVGDIVKVWVLSVDKSRRRVSLTMIPPGTERQRPSGRGKGRRGRDESAPRRSARQGSQESRSERSQESRPERRGQSERPPRADGRTPSEGQTRSRHGGRPPRQPRDRRPPRTDYRPKSPPKPVTPITDEMKTGKEPMRSFSDLIQFFQPTDPPEAKENPRAGSKPPKKPNKPPKPPAAEPEHEPEAPSIEPAPDDAAASQPLPEPKSQVDEQQEEMPGEPPPVADR